MIESVVPDLSYHTAHSHRQHCWLFRWSVQYLTHDSLFSGGTNTYGALAKGKAARACFVPMKALSLPVEWNYE